jgi:protein TonB
MAVSRDLIAPVAVSTVNPKYPDLARRTKTTGTVVLNLQIDASGKVVKATPVSGPAIFHGEAINAAKQWKYKPASLNGENVASQSTITFNFK